MEENKSKNGAGVAVLLIIGVLVIALLCAIVYMLQSNNSKDIATGDTNNSEQTINTLKTEIDSLKNTIAQKDNEIKNNENKEPVVQTKEMTSDEKYEIFVDNLKKEIANLPGKNDIFGTYDIEYNDLGEYYVRLNSEGNLSIHFHNEKLEKEYGTDKLATDVIAFYSCYTGQDASKTLFIIKSDGTLWTTCVEAITWEENHKINFKKETKYKNIVSVLQGYFSGDGYGGAVGPILVDIDGKTYEY